MAVIHVAICFFLGWSLFPIVFVLSPQYTGVIEPALADILHAIADIASKNAYSLLGWRLRWVYMEKHLSKERERRHALHLKEDAAFEEQRQAIAKRTARTALRAADGMLRVVGSHLAEDLVHHSELLHRRRQLRILLIEPDPAVQMQIMTALHEVSGGTALVEPVFRLTDVPQVIARG